METKKDVSTEFLLREYENSNIEWRRVRDGGLNSLKALFTAITIVLGGVGLLFQSNNIPLGSVSYVFITAFGFLTLMGWQTHQYMIARIINTDQNTRAMARIRRYFLDHDPEIEQYLTWQTDDSPTRFLISKIGIAIIAKFLFSALISGMLVSIISLLNNNWLQLFLIFVCVCSVSYYCISWQMRIKISKYREIVLSEQRFGPVTLIPQSPAD